VIQLCEAFGCTAVIVETVGVGQSEVAVSGLVDCFLLLLLAGAGDEVQGIKKGVIEMADLAAVTKCDGANLVPAKIARQMALNAFHLMGRETEVLLTSSVTGDGLAELWDAVDAFVWSAETSGEKAARRGRQGVQWMTEILDQEVLGRFYANPRVTALLRTLQEDVRGGRATPRSAAERVLSVWPES
jgi:LAO/AO transport system kinase